MTKAASAVSSEAASVVTPLQTIVVRAREKLGLKDFRLHDLRHEATSKLFEKGLSPIEVATMTGHKTLNTLKRYTHPNVTEIARKLG